MGRLATFVAAGAVLVVSVLPASAQAPRPERPYRGLFGSGVGDAEQALTASASMATGWDDNLRAAARGDTRVSPTGIPAESGSLGTFSGGLNYSFQRDLVTIHASATTAARYFPSLARQFIRASQGRLTLSTSPREGTSVSVSASASLQPYALNSLFPGDTDNSVAASDVIDLDGYMSGDPRLSYAGSLSASQQLSRRTGASASYAYRRTEKPGVGTDFIHQNIGVRLTHGLASGVSAHAGYGYGEGRALDQESYPHHRIDAGINYNRALSFTRRTTVSFNTGSTATQRNDRFRFHLTGSARVTHEIGRTWAAWAAYGRSVQFHETWREPGLGNSVTFGLGGLLSRRVQFNAAGRAAFGTVGTQSGAPGFDHYAATASLSYAVTRFMSTVVSYGYYTHRYDDDVPLAAAVPRTLDRNSVRVGINLWAPIFQRARRTDASR
jgi:hypothetical protein